MRFSLAAALLFATSRHAVSAFVPSGVDHRRGLVSLKMAEEPPKKLTSQDIINRARQAVGMPDVEEAPKIFEDDLLDDMQQSLLKLEKRVKEGPGSLGVEEVLDFEAATKRILTEMKEKLASEQSGAPQGASTSSVAAVASTSPPPSSPAASSTPAAQETTASTTAPPSAKAGYGITDKSNDEGPAYDGTGGMGVARGTRNTYVIPGMDEMSPEEYRAALQKSVSDRQSLRRGKYGGVVGNRAALQYLDQLGWGGSSNNWKANDHESSSDVQDAAGPANVAPPVPSPAAAAVPAPAPVTHEHNPVPASYEQVKINEAHKVVDKVVAPTEVDEDAGYGITDLSNDEGPAYDGTGGMGVARGTRNTYVIPGMDEMSPEEYRAALQKSVSNRQTRRKGKYGGVVGNRAALQYLDQLGWGGSSSNWKSKGSNWNSKGKQ